MYLYTKKMKFLGQGTQTGQTDRCPQMHYRATFAGGQKCYYCYTI